MKATEHLLEMERNKDHAMHNRLKERRKEVMGGEEEDNYGLKLQRSKSLEKVYA